MGFVIINMLINTYSERQEDSPSGSIANARIRSSFLQLKATKDASGERERPSVCRWLDVYPRVAGSPDLGGGR